MQSIRRDPFSEYRWNRLRVTDFCSTCQFARTDGNSYFVLSDLKVSAERGCRVCAFLHEALKHYFGDAYANSERAFHRIESGGHIMFAASHSSHLTFFVTPGKLSVHFRKPFEE